jgi:hypothetical protein
LTILSVAKNNEWIMNWKDGKGSGCGLIYSTSQHLRGGLREPTKKSLRKLSLSRRVNSVIVYWCMYIHWLWCKSKQHLCHSHLTSSRVLRVVITQYREFRSTAMGWPKLN